MHSTDDFLFGLEPRRTGLRESAHHAYRLAGERFRSGGGQPYLKDTSSSTLDNGNPVACGSHFDADTCKDAEVKQV